MKTYRHELTFHVPTRRAFLKITDQVQECVGKSGVREGLALCNSMHISSSIFINDNESGLFQDWEKWLEKLAPEKPHGQYRHNDTGEDNADAHLKRTIMGHQVILPITAGKLDLGPWEQVFYAEFDGQRKKRVVIKVMGE